MFLMAELVQEDDTQHSLRIGDTVLLYAREKNGFVFSELTRYIMPEIVDQ